MSTESVSNVQDSAARGPEINPTTLLRAVRKNWPLSLATALIVSFGCAFYTLGQPKIYQASATILLNPTAVQPLGSKVDSLVDMGAGMRDTREYYETQYNLITSMRVAKAVVEHLGLNHDARFLNNQPPGPQLPPAEASVDDAASALVSRIRVEPVKDSSIASVKLEDADPERAQLVLATLVETYCAMNLDEARASMSQAVDWLRGQSDTLRGELETSEMALHEYKRDKNILSVTLDDQSNMLRAEMTHLNDALTTVRTKREEISARREELSKVKEDAPSILPSTELLGSGLLFQVREAYVQAVRDRDSLLRGGKAKNHPDVASAQAKVDAARDAILTEVHNIQGALDRDLSVIRRQEAGLSGLFEDARRRAFELNRLEVDYNRLRRSKDNNEKLFSLVLERTKESDLTRMLQANNVRVVDLPLRPGGPIRPRVSFNIGMGIFVGILLGLLAAIARAALDSTVKTAEEIEQEIGTTFLGLLPEIKDLSTLGPKNRRRRTALAGSPPELVAHNFPMSGISEAARAIRTNLLFMAPDHPFRTLLFTSAGPGEGKTTMACSIAIAIAQAGQRVVLVDCDLRKPRIHRIFRKSAATGVTTALLSESLDDVVHETEVPNLSVIGAGPLPPNPAELIHSDRFRSFLAELSKRFDRVIIDSPPVVAVTDAAVLSTLADGTVLVVRAFKTSKDVARHALRALSDVGTKLAGAVLNAVNLNRSEYRYSHYYYYSREGYYGEDTSAGGPSDPNDPTDPSAPTAGGPSAGASPQHPQAAS